MAISRGIIQGSFIGGRPIIPIEGGKLMNRPTPFDPKSGARHIQAKNGPAGSRATPVPETLLRLPPTGNGHPLPDALRRHMEGIFKTGFAEVRIHEGRIAQAFGAMALTMGYQIHFAQGRYQPNTPQGLKLLGHELAHVVQQKMGRVVNPLGSGAAIIQNPALEAEADCMGLRAMNQPLPLPRHRVAGPPVLQAMRRLRESKEDEVAILIEPQRRERSVKPLDSGCRFADCFVFRRDRAYFKVGAKLYHGTLSGDDDRWWETSFPTDFKDGFSYGGFYSTVRTGSPKTRNRMVLLTYTVKTPDIEAIQVGTYNDEARDGRRGTFSNKECEVFLHHDTAQRLFGPLSSSNPQVSGLPQSSGSCCSGLWSGLSWVGSCLATPFVWAASSCRSKKKTGHRRLEEDDTFEV